MPELSDYSQIRRFDTDKGQLKVLSKRVVVLKGWEIQEENTSSLVVAVPQEKGRRAPFVTIQIPGDFMFVKCESGSLPDDYLSNKEHVMSFFRALEEELTERG
jgi:hypothetical protein